MSGYPAKIKSFDWVGETPFLVTSGAHEAVCWPFDGKFGPMERTPVCVANNNNELVTCVTALPGDEALFVGFRDGSVLAAEVNESKRRSSCSERIRLRNNSNGYICMQNIHFRRRCKRKYFMGPSMDG